MAGDDRRDDLPGGPGRPEGSDDEFVRELLGALEHDRSAPPEQLPDRTIRKVQAELTSRDLIDLTTFVFLMRFCAPLLDLLAAFFGHDPLSPPESMAPSRDRTRSRSEDRSDPDE